MNSPIVDCLEPRPEPLQPTSARPCADASPHWHASSGWGEAPLSIHASGDRHAELKSIDANLATVRRALECYLTAFENGTLDAELLTERITPLRARQTDLEHRRAQVELDLDTEPPAPSPLDPGPGRRRHPHHHRPRHPEPDQALIEALVEQVTVNAANELTLSFRVPDLPPSPGQIIDAITAVARNDEAVAATTAGFPLVAWRQPLKEDGDAIVQEHFLLSVPRGRARIPG